MREGWVYKKLNEVCDKGSSNVVINKLVDNNGDYPLFGASGIVKNVDFFHQDKEYIGIVKDGAGVGRVNTYPAYSSLVGTMQYIFPKEQCLLNYVKYFLIKLDLSHCVSGATIPHIYFKDYGKELIPVPSLEEQHSIVAELDEINNLLNLKRKELETYDKLAQSLFYEMFGDPVKNEKGWEVKKLGEIADVKGRVGWKGYKKEDLRNSGPYVLGATHLAKNGSIDMSSPVFLSREKYEESPEIFVKEKDIILAQRGSIGKVALVREEIGEATINPCVLIIRPVKIDSEFFLHYFLNEHLNQKLQNMNTGGVQPMITQKQVNALDIPLPPLPLQQLFASRIEAIEAQKTQARAAIEKLETLLASRMQYWFE